MCLLVLGYRLDPDCPIWLLANREESSHRPCLAPQQVNPGVATAWLGGRDLVAGGTWLGVNARGVVAAVTNRPRPGSVESPVSRGLLCRAMLELGDPASMVAHAQSELRSGRYAGCNLVVAEAAEAYVVEFGERLDVRRMTPGLHLLTNGSLNDPHDPRIVRVRHEFESRGRFEPTELPALGRAICGLHADGGEPALCLHGPEWGTVSSSLIRLPNCADSAGYWYADGPPCTAPYADYSGKLQELLGTQQHAA